MTKEDKQLKKEFFMGGHINPKCQSAMFCKPHNELKPVTYDLEKIWNWINKYYVSKSWVEKELIGEDEKRDYGCRAIQTCGENIEKVSRNWFRKQMRNKLKEKE